MRSLPYIFAFAALAFFSWTCLTIGMSSFMELEFSPPHTWTKASRGIWFLVGVPLTAFGGLFGHFYWEAGK